MVQHGVVAAVTVPLMRLLQIVLCLRRRAPHRCGFQNHPEQLGGRLCFSHAPRFSALQEVNKMVLSVYLHKLSVYVPMIKTAITSRGFICTSLTGETSGTIKLATMGTFASQNVLRILEIVLPNVTFSKY